MVDPFRNLYDDVRRLIDNNHADDQEIILLGM